MLRKIADWEAVGVTTILVEADDPDEIRHLRSVIESDEEPKLMAVQAPVKTATTHDEQFGLTGDQQRLLAQADDFARRELAPLSRRMDDEEWWPENLMADLGRQGMLGSTIGDEFGGAGMSLLESGLVLQAFARWNPAVALCVMVHDNLCANNVYLNGNDELRGRYLPRMCGGELVGCLGLTEPGAGSDALGSMRTRAVRDGDVYRITGSKLFIAACHADVLPLPSN